ncbi:MAG: hypothetical protein ACKVWV_10595 [Planctomycetota bacterium]
MVCQNLTPASSRSLNLTIELVAWGRGPALHAVRPPNVCRSSNRLELDRGELVEWYIEDARGIEQGFTVRVSPHYSPSVDAVGDPLTLVLSFGGEFVPGDVRDERTLVLESTGGGSPLLYTGLYVVDANGGILPSRLGVANGFVAIEVDDRGAAYPIVVDPWIVTQEAVLSSAPGEFFARSVDIDGDTIVVGALGYNPVPTPGGFGAAYVYTRSGSTWALQAQLTASDPEDGDVFGRHVAIDGDTIAVAADLEDHDGFTAAGAVYVFVRNGSTWTQQAKLVASDSSSLAGLGASVAVHGDTVVAGAPSASAPNASGAVYVFVRSGSTWTQQAKLTSFAPRLGESVAIWGDTVVAGSPIHSWILFGEGSARVFVRNGTTWTQQSRLVASDASPSDSFGRSVAILGDTIAVGADTWESGDGAVYVFQREGARWTETQKLTPSMYSSGQLPTHFGGSVSIDQERLLIGGPVASSPGLQFAGRAYLFERVGGAYLERASIMSSDATGDQRFGSTVAISGSTLVVGNEDVGTPDGKAYIFETHAEDLFCFGDGSLATACPCAPPESVPIPSGAPESGCANSFDIGGAELRVGGLVQPDTLIFRADIGPGYGGFALLVKSDAEAAQGIANNDGIRCVDGSMVRFGGHLAGSNGDSPGTWAFPNSNQTTPVSLATSQGPAQTAHYQLLYRNAVSGFCSPATANWTNAIRIFWP